MAALKLSVIVIAYNMQRELPRTIRSLSPSAQQGIAGDDYEVIVVDNGSDVPPDPAALQAFVPKLKVFRQADPTPSPVRAIHTGLQAARGELVGVFIDGARMASPGLLGAALRAAALHPRPVVGAIGFHLGPAIQRDSMQQGYNQAVEDKLLADSHWEEDGYRLFDISVFAGASARGWFDMPGETSSLFMRKRH